MPAVRFDWMGMPRRTLLELATRAMVLSPRSGPERQSPVSSVHRLPSATLSVEERCDSSGQPARTTFADRWPANPYCAAKPGPRAAWTVVGAEGQSPGTGVRHIRAGGGTSGVDPADTGAIEPRPGTDQTAAAHATRRLITTPAAMHHITSRSRRIRPAYPSARQPAEGFAACAEPLVVVSAGFAPQSLRSSRACSQP